MSKQGRHHYIPIFYLKQWARDDGRICEFSRPHDRVKARKVHPAGTAYMDGLNTVTGLPLTEQQYLEDVFYKAADNDAARALKTESNIRTAWKMRALIPKINDRIACQSRKYVYGTNDAQLSFVSKRLGKKYTADPLEHLTHQQLKNLLKPRQD
jgi:hypothetical protein